MKKLLGRLMRVSPAMVVAMFALLVALGGVSTAAQIQSSPQASEASSAKQHVGKRGPRGRRGLRGRTGPRGLRGLTGATGAAGAKGDKGDQGDIGPAGPFVDTLPPGRSLKGAWVVDGYGADFGDSAVSYDIPLPSGPTMHFIQKTDATPAGCTGSVNNPGAAPGHACFFVGFTGGTAGLMGGMRPESGLENGPGSVRGVILYAQGTTVAGAKWETMGTWAVTAPS